MGGSSSYRYRFQDVGLLGIEKNKFEKDPEMKKHVEAYERHARDNLQAGLARSDVDLDGRFFLHRE